MSESLSETISDSSNWALVFGYTGTFLCVSSFLFQIYLVFKNKSTKDISYGFIVLQLLVNVLFTVYNSVIFNLPILLNNGIMTFLAIVLLFQKLYYDVYLVKMQQKQFNLDTQIKEVMDTIDNDNHDHSDNHSNNHSDNYSDSHSDNYSDYHIDNHNKQLTNENEV